MPLTPEKSRYCNRLHRNDSFQIMFGPAAFEVALASRILLGIFNGLVVTSKTVASEIVPRDRRDWQAKKSMSRVSAGVASKHPTRPTVEDGSLRQLSNTLVHFDNDF